MATFIQDYCLDKISRGLSFSIDFEKRSLKIDGKKIISKGKVVGKDDYGHPLYMYKRVDTPDEFLVRVADLYNMYYHSRPSESSEKHRKLYFKALSLDEISNDDFMFGAPRNESRFELEFYILKSIISGTLFWDEPYTKPDRWFLQHPYASKHTSHGSRWRDCMVHSDSEYAGLIILRDWVKPAE